MAKAHSSKMATTGVRKVKMTNVLVFMLIGLLILGLAGFGIGNFTGNVGAIGSVGNEEITIDEYRRNLNSELQRVQSQTGQNLSLAEASVYGVAQRALERTIFFASLDNESNEIGLSVGDATVLRRLQESDQFTGLDGAFDIESYEFLLERLGFSAAEYEELLREDAARELLQFSVTSALRPSSQFAHMLLEFVEERRSFRWVEVTSGMLTVPKPTWNDSELKDYYEANPERFTLPERRNITFAWLMPDMLIDTVEISQQDVRALYDEREEIYHAPERRDVDRLVFPDEESAIEAELRLRGGSVDFDGLLEERGVLLADIELGEVERKDLSSGAADAVFSVADLGIVGPVQSNLGPAIFRINAVLKSNISFDEAKKELEAEIASTRARQFISDQVEAYEDLLVGGATLEQLASETAMQLGNISFSDDTPYGGIAEHTEFRSAAQAVEAEDFPELLGLQDGGVFALRLDSLLEPQLQPLDEVRSTAAELLETELVGQQLRELGESIEAGLTGGKDFGDLNLFPFIENEVTRTRFVAAAPAQLVAEVFKLKEGEILVHQQGNRVVVARLDEIVNVDFNSPDIRAARDSLSTEIALSIGDDAFVLFAIQLRRSAGLELDQAVINAVHSQFQ